MSIIRVKKDKGFFAASNIPFNDVNLSWEARGVLGYLLSKPEDWQVRFYDLVKQGPAGEYKMRRILKELEENKYLERQLINKKDEKGKFDWVSTVYETPTIPRLSIDGLPTDGLSIDGSPTRGKPRDILSTDPQTTEPKRTKLETDGVEEPNPDGIYADLSIAFCNKTKIPELTGGPKAWFDSLTTMGEAGVTPEDIENAIDILRDKKYSIVRLSSVENTAIGEMSKRVGEGPDTDSEEARRKYRLYKGQCITCWKLEADCVCYEEAELVQ